MTSRNNFKSFGGKAKGLFQLKEHGLPVPDFMVISAQEVEDVLHDNDKMNLLYQRIKDKFSTAKIAVRSSADKEDGSYKSYAGCFSTVLNVKIEPNLLRLAIQKVFDSTHRAGLKNIRMNIVIQAMVKPLIAGVCFSDAFDEHQQNVCLFSFVTGLANKLVDGKTKATNVSYKIENNKISPTDFSCRGDLHNYVGHLDKLIPFIQTIREKIYTNADIEWCIDHNGCPWIVQLRPITKTIHLSQETQKYVVASQGEVRGKAYCIDSSLPTEQLQTAIRHFKQNSILVSEYTDTFFMPAIKKASAILTSEGDILSHSAITSRELNIPCLVGINDLLSKIKTGDNLYINTSKNILEINGVNFSGIVANIDWTSVYDFSYLTELTMKNKTFLFENVFDEYILYYPQEVSPQTLTTLTNKLAKQTGAQIQLSNSNKYHWYFEWKNFNNLAVFNKYYLKAAALAQKFDYQKVSQFYKDVFDECLCLKNNKQSDHRLNTEKIISLYFLLDMLLPMGISIKYAYLKANALSGKNLPLSMLFSQTSSKNQKLLKIQKYLSTIEHEKNTIFQKFMDHGLLSYDFLQIRDQQIRALFHNKYPKYSAKMYQLFYKKYIKDAHADN